MMPAIASERSIFSKNHDYNSYIKSFSCLGEHVRTYISGSRCTRWQKTTNRHTHTHTCRTATVTITARAIRQTRRLAPLANKNIYTLVNDTALGSLIRLHAVLVQ